MRVLVALLVGLGIPGLLVSSSMAALTDVTLTPTDTTISVSATRDFGSVVSIRLFDATRANELQAICTSANPATHTFTGLNESTDYSVRFIERHTCPGSFLTDIWRDVSTTESPLMDAEVPDQAYLVDIPSVSTIVDETSGLRWEVYPRAGDKIVDDADLNAGWRIELYDAFDDTVSTEDDDIYGDVTHLECGTLGQTGDGDVCAGGISLSDIRGSERVQFSPIVQRVSSSRVWESDHVGEFFSFTQPGLGMEVFWTIEVPEAQPHYIDGMLSLGVTPVLGSSFTQLRIDGSWPPRQYGTPAETSVQTATLHAEVEPEGAWLEFQLRGARAVGTDTAVMAPGGGTFTATQGSWVYTPWSQPRSIFVGTPEMELEDVPTPTAGLMTALEELEIAPDAEGLGMLSKWTMAAIALAMGIGITVACNAARTPGPLAVGVGAMAAGGVWAILGPALAGVPWPLAFGPLLLPIAGAIAVLRS